MERAVLGQEGLMFGIARSQDIKNLIYHLRYQVYIHEMGKNIFIADHKKQNLKDDLDDEGYLFYIRKAKQIAATVRLNFYNSSQSKAYFHKTYGLDHFLDFPLESITFSSRLIVHPDWRNTRILLHLFKYFYEEIKDRNIKFNFCTCAPYLVGLYQHLGYRRYKDNVIDPDVGYRIPMVMLANDKKYLKSVRSIFSRLIPDEQNDPLIGKWFQARFPNYIGYINERLIPKEDFFNYLSVRIHNDSSPIFRDLSSEDTQEFLSKSTVLNCKKGDVIINQGELANDMFLILKGSVDVSVNSNSKTYHLTVLGKGELFGEMAFLGKMRRSATVKACEDLELLILTHTFLKKLMNVNPEITLTVMINISAMLSTRLKNTTQSWLKSNEEDIIIEPVENRDFLELGGI
ncbi:MAG: cyclic nucleotide-binding domain-containing protein [Pseudomonadota bacterium]